MTVVAQEINEGNQYQFSVLADIEHQRLSNNVTQHNPRF
jgi:hypothetical protein